VNEGAPTAVCLGMTNGPMYIHLACSNTLIFPYNRNNHFTVHVKVEDMSLVTLETRYGLTGMNKIRHPYKSDTINNKYRYNYQNDERF